MLVFIFYVLVPIIILVTLGFFLSDKFTDKRTEDEEFGDMIKQAIDQAFIDAYVQIKREERIKELLDIKTKELEQRFK